MDNKRIPHTFYVELEGIEHGRFEKCEGLEAFVDVIEFEEGGSNTTRKFLGKSKWSNIILQNGIDVNNELFDWYKGYALDNRHFARKDGSVVLKNLTGAEIKRWNFFNAFPCRWIGPSLEAKISSDYAVERIEIAHEGIILDTNTSEPNNFRIGQTMPGDTYTQTMRVTVYKYVRTSYEVHLYEATGIEYRRGRVRQIAESQEYSTEAEAINAMELNMRNEVRTGRPPSYGTNSIEIKEFASTYQQRINGEYVWIEVYSINRWEVRRIIKTVPINE
jgi:phage tail-like protein